MIRKESCNAQYSSAACALLIRAITTQLQNTVQGKAKVLVFLKSVLPEEVPYDKDGTRTQRKEELMKDIVDGAGVSNMSIRVTFVSTAPLCMLSLRVSPY